MNSTITEPLSSSSPNVRSCFKKCYDKGHMADIFERATSQLCAASKFIGLTEDSNLLLSETFAPLKHNQIPMRTYVVRNMMNNLENKTFDKNIGNKDFEFSGRAVAVKIMFVSKIQVTAIFVLLSGDSGFDRETTFVALLPNMTYVRVDVIVSRLRGDVVSCYVSKCCLHATTPPKYSIFRSRSSQNTACLTSLAL